MQAHKKKAFNLWLEAAKLGNADSILAVAECLYHGSGTERDLLAAQEWCHLAIRCSDTDYSRQLMGKIQAAVMQSSEPGPSIAD